MNIILVRHAETEHNIRRVLQGHRQGKLSKKGIIHAQRTAEALKDEHIDAIYSSDLARAADTARIIAKHHEADVKLSPDIRERDYGSLTGKPVEEVDWDNIPKDAETLEQLQSRIKKFIQEIYKKHKDDTVLLVSHGRASRAILSVLRGLGPKRINDMEDIENCSITRIHMGEKNTFEVNNTSHLMPSREECLQWYRNIGTPQNIINHVKAVNKVAVFLAEHLEKKGIDIDIDVVDKASLLHDLDKWLCIQDDTVEHGFRTEQMLIKKGFPELGRIARQHRADLILKGLDTWEEKVISYADRRIVNDDIVSMQERFAYLKQKYPMEDKKRSKAIEAAYDELEQEIFSRLDFGPKDLKTMC